MARLSGHAAIVTGGAKGIGRHYSRALAAEGARVMIADIADGKELTQEIAAEHGANSVASAIADVSDETSVKVLVAAAIERFGKIDVLVNNAALFAPLQETKCTEIDGELWDKVMAVNLRGPFLMVKHVAPHMIAQGYGKIINIGSGTAFRGDLKSTRLNSSHANISYAVFCFKKKKSKSKDLRGNFTGFGGSDS